jgi:hypothetical protein
MNPSLRAGRDRQKRSKHPRRPLPLCLRLQNPPHLPPRPSHSRGVHHLRDLEPIKPARRTARVRAHALEPQPVAHRELRRKGGDGRDAVDRVAGRAPDAAGARGCAEGHMEGAAHGEHLGRRVAVVEDDAVEGAVDTIADVVCANFINNKSFPVENRGGLHITFGLPASSGFSLSACCSALTPTMGARLAIIETASWNAVST